MSTWYASFFSFNNVMYYKQIFGMPVGDLASLVLADLVKDDLVIECL